MNKEASGKYEGIFMKSRKPFLRGNTLTEYGIILGLLGITAIGALILLGNSNSELLGGVKKGVSGSDAVNLVQLNFSGTSNSTVNGGNPGRQSPAGNTGSEPGLTLKDFQSSGTNFTSVDGVRARQTIAQKTMKLTANLRSIANTTDSETSTWLTVDIIPRIQALAAAEGYAANIPTLTKNVLPGSYSREMALTDVLSSRNNLMYKLTRNTYVPYGETGEVTVTPDPKVAQAIQDIMNMAIEGSKTFVPVNDGQDTAADWDLEIYSAYGGDKAIQASLEEAENDGSINENAVVAETAKGAETLGTLTP